MIPYITEPENNSIKHQQILWQMEQVEMLKMLAVLALVLLVSSMNEGRVVRKCELKTRLEAAQFHVIKSMRNNVTFEHVIARLVCSVENTSGFNTSLITQINLDDLRPPSQSLPLPKEPEDHEKMEEEEIIPLQPQRRLKGRPQRSIPMGKVISSAAQGGTDLFWSWQRDLFPKKSPAESSGSSSEESSEESGSGDSSEEEPDDVTTPNLFGIFQLGDHVACDSGSNRTLNLCGLECSALVDDDITDDVICLKTLAERHGRFNSFVAKKRFFAKMMAMLSVRECRSIIPSEYFAECS